MHGKEKSSKSPTVIKGNTKYEVNDILAMKRNQDKRMHPSLLKQMEAQLFNVYEGLCLF